MNSNKICLIGDGGCGKSCLIKKLMGFGFQQKYIATLGVEANKINIKGKEYLFWDCAGQEKLGGLREGYYLGSAGAIIMFDLSHPITYKNVANWARDFARICPGKPILVVGNKKEIDVTPGTDNIIKISVKNESREEIINKLFG